MSFSELEFMKSLVSFEGYDLNDEQLVSLLTDDEDNFVQRFHIGFMFLIDNINEDLGTTYLRVLNDIVSEYKLFYYEKELDNKLKELGEIEEPVLRATKLLQYLFNKKYFKDCNEVTALLFTSAMMIQERIGVISVPSNLKDLFIEMMNDQDDELFAKFIYEFCIDRSLFSN